MERGDRQPTTVAQGQVGKARYARIVGVDDIELVRRERQRQVRAHADRNAERAPARNGNGGPERDGSFQRTALALEQPKSAATGGEVLRAVGRPKDNHLMAAPAKCLGSGLDVLVHRVRPRPRERRHHANP
jgi:hypothetical protein